MRLTFVNNNFILHDGIICDADIKHWRRCGYRSYSTNNLKLAARFKHCADNRADKIFKKFTLQSINVPSGEPFTPQGLELFKFQREKCVPHMLGLNKSYSALSPGLGKTINSIAAVSMKPGRTLIICPSFLKNVWAREITKWFKNDFPSISVIPNLKGVNYGADFVICSDGMLHNPEVLHALRKEKFRFNFVDESQRFKTPDAKRTIALFGGRTKKFQAPGLLYDAEHVAFLSGTPMLNRPIELWPVLYAMAPEEIDFMSYNAFGMRYGGPTRNEFGGFDFLGSSNEDELRERITKRFMLVIKKENVLPDLPKKIREVIPMTEDGRAADVTKLDREMVLKFQKKKQGQMDLGEYAEIRRLNGLAKVDWSARFISDILSNDLNESVIVFAHHREVVANLSLALTKFKPMVINGGVDLRRRTEFQDEFQNGRRRLFIGNIDAMNLGLTLTRATRVIFVEYSWTPAQNEQAEDRANRIGSEWSIFCQYIVLPGSIDEDILQSNILKQTRIEKIIA